jgi:hypothetical protein
MYGTMSMEVLKQQREELLREAELNHLKKALKANRKRPATSQWASIVTWELARAAGILRKFFRTPKNPD